MVEITQGLIFMYFAKGAEFAKPTFLLDFLRHLSGTFPGRH